MLPVDAQKYLVRGNRLRFDLEPFVVIASEAGGRPCDLLSLDGELWALDGDQYEPDFVPSLWRRLANVRDADLALLDEHSQVIVGDQPVLLCWRLQDVEAFAKSWKPMSHLADGRDPLPWESKPKRRGPKRVRWRVLLEEATAAKGGKLTPEEALAAIRAGGVAVTVTDGGLSIDGEHIGADTFRNAPGNAARKLAKK